MVTEAMKVNSSSQGRIHKEEKQKQTLKRCAKGSGTFKHYDKKQLHDENQVDKLLQSPRKQGQ